MLRVLKAAWRAAVSAFRLVRVKCVETGQWLLRLVPDFSAPAPPAPTIEEYVPDVAEPAQEDVYAVVKRAVADMHAGRAPQIQDIAQLGPDTLNWIRVMEPHHRTLLLGASVERIREHARGKKVIRGLLAADRESVQAYLAAKRRRQDAELEAELDPDQEMTAYANLMAR